EVVGLPRTASQERPQKSLDIRVQSQPRWRPSSSLLRESCFFFENRFSESSQRLGGYRPSLERLGQRLLCPTRIASLFSMDLQIQDPQFPDPSAGESGTRQIHRQGSGMREAPCRVSSQE